MSDIISFPDRITAASRQLMDRCIELQRKIVFAESCTGGLIAAAMTEIPGSSQVVERGFVVYSNSAKQQLLNVPKDLIDRFGAVSEPVAIAMAQGALQAAQGLAHLSIAVTGVAGPGGTPTKPEGLVHIAVGHQAQPASLHEKHEFGAIGRSRIREATVLAALQLALRRLENTQLP
jgi:nicotinamide-nucleotide amidase